MTVVQLPSSPLLELALVHHLVVMEVANIATGLAQEGGSMWSCIRPQHLLSGPVNESERSSYEMITGDKCPVKLMVDVSTAHRQALQ